MELLFPAQKLKRWLSRRRPMREEKPSPCASRRFPDSSRGALTKQHCSITQKIQSLGRSRAQILVTVTAMTLRTAMAASTKSPEAEGSTEQSSSPAKKGKKGRPKKAGPTKPKVRREKLVRNPISLFVPNWNWALALGIYDTRLCRACIPEKLI